MARRAATSKTDSLAAYRAKRHFDRTPEPAGVPRTKRSIGLRFVVQEHDASHLHYDFRLEHAGVLWSWAIPRGPSLDPAVRRLAARTEDHPLDYVDFEGVIPEGEYGGGTVIVWDQGTWQPEGDPVAAMDRGRIAFELDGTKLHGRFHLVRLRPKSLKDRESWLLMKSRDDDARPGSDVAAEQPKSALTGRTLAQVEARPDRTWHSDRAEKTTPQRRSNRRARSEEELAQIGDALGVDLTHLEEPAFPKSSVTKGELLAHYARCWPRMEPLVVDRPLMLLRCPDPSKGRCFVQKHATSATPDNVGRVPIEEAGGATREHVVLRDLRGLVALAQLRTLELHLWAARADRIELPDRLVLDLDPDRSLAFAAVQRAALDVRDRLAQLGLESFACTSGGAGIHVVAPIERRHDWSTHAAFARALAETMAREDPEKYVARSGAAARRGRIFVDYLRDARGATAVAPYSPRANEEATVATPLAWSEVERGTLDPSRFTVRTTPARIESTDPWEGYASRKQRLTKKMLDALLR